MTNHSGAQRSTVIEVFADIGCPFTHVGLRRLVDERAARGRDDVVMRVRAWPLEIVNGRPLDPTFIAEEIDDIRGQAAPDLFTGFDVDAFPATSIPALAVTAAAYLVDDRTGEAVALAIRDLLFERGQDVADPTVLAAVAHDHGVDVPVDADQLVLADHHEGVARGVIGSPHFFVAAGGFFCPALDVSRDANGHLRVHADPAGFDAFLTTVFA
jgi:predicted DsbA family dithiol-disulfide isomerase